MGSRAIKNLLDLLRQPLHLDGSCIRALHATREAARLSQRGEGKPTTEPSNHMESLSSDVMNLMYSTSQRGRE